MTDDATRDITAQSQYTVLRYFLALLRSGNAFAMEQLHDTWIHYDRGRAQLADALEAALLKIRALEPEAIPDDLFDSLPFQSLLHIPDKQRSAPMITDFYADETARALTEEIFPALERAARAEFWTILGETDVDESDCAEIRTQGDLLLKHISAYLAGLVEMYSTYGLRAFGSPEHQS